MKLFKKILSVILAVIVLAVCCGISVSAESPELNKSKLYLLKGESFTLKVSGDYDSITWSSSNDKICTVTSKGKVTAHSLGTAYVYAKTGNKKLTCKVMAVRSYFIEPDDVNIKENESFTLTFKAPGVKKINAQITDTKTAKVTACSVKNSKANIKIKGLSEGSTKLIVTDKNNKYCKIYIKITVRPEGYTFRTDELFDYHYEKHGSEFGKITAEEYLQKANALIKSTSKNVLHKESKDGDTLYFNKKTNEFLSLSPDGYIRTYFIAEKGIDYYNRQ